MMGMLITKLKEPTTYAGIFAILNAVGVAIKPELWQEMTTVFMGLAGAALVLYKEKKR